MDIKIGEIYNCKIGNNIITCKILKHIKWFIFEYFTVEYKRDIYKRGEYLFSENKCKDIPRGDILYKL